MFEAVDATLGYLHVHRKRMVLPTFNYSMTDVHSKEGIHLRNLMFLMQNKNMDIIMLNEHAPHKVWICVILAELT